MGSYLVYRPLDGHLFLRGVRNSGLFQGIVFYFAVHGAVIVPDTIVLCVVSGLSLPQKPLRLFYALKCTCSFLCAIPLRPSGISHCWAGGKGFIFRK